ncbi:unnamed protein product [Rangifer tarandus platyrhynchus]|uniref:Uncharacterized protein n=1 Tax=Rangifer tarandus platyrhynchus TaxID=3082113 RepID=A0AC59Z2D5_RANTA
MGLTQRWHRIHDGSGVVSGDNGPWSLAGSWFHTPVPTPAAPPAAGASSDFREIIRLDTRLDNPHRGSHLRCSHLVPPGGLRLQLQLPHLTSAPKPPALPCFLHLHVQLGCQLKLFLLRRKGICFFNALWQPPCTLCWNNLESHNQKNEVWPLPTPHKN